jgi:hypothetical protein
MNRSQLERPIKKAQVIEFPRLDVEEKTELESSAEARLQVLTDTVEGFGHAAFTLFLTERGPVREAIEELVVKVNALQWIVRIARRATGPVREGLWADIERILADLEKTAGSVMNAAEMWAHLELADSREPVVCMRRS